MMKIIKIIFILGISLNSFAQIPFRLPAIFSNHAVLQQSSGIKLWGWGPGSLKVAIVCSWSPFDTIFALIGGDCDGKQMSERPKPVAHIALSSGATTKLPKLKMF